MKLGIAGNLTRVFIASPLTPLFLLASLIVGIVALVTLPREEEPQISVRSEEHTSELQSH